MTFSFYYSVRALPRELDEVSRVLRLTRWQRYWKIEVPNGIVGLVWNGMMSFGGGWFFLAACEAISVLNRQYTLPGVGSYVARGDRRRRPRQGRPGDRDDGRHGDRRQRAVLAAADRVGGALQARGVLRRRAADARSCSTCCAARAGRASSGARVAPLAEPLGRAMRVLGRDGTAPVAGRRRRAPPRRPASSRSSSASRSPTASTGWSPTSARTATARCSRRSATARSPSCRVIVLVVVRHAGVGADRRLDRPQPAGRAARPADRADPRQLPGQLPVPVRHRGVHHDRASASTSAASC